MCWLGRFFLVREELKKLIFPLGRGDQGKLLKKVKFFAEGFWISRKLKIVLEVRFFGQNLVRISLKSQSEFGQNLENLGQND